MEAYVSTTSCSRKQSASYPLLNRTSVFDGSVRFLRRWTEHGRFQEIKDMRFSPLRKFELATASVDGSISVFDAKVKKAVVSFTSAHESPATGVVFSPTNRVFLSSCGLDKRILFFDSAANKYVIDVS